jgi:hypothetical protein
MGDIFEGAVEEASQEIENENGLINSNDLPEELQSELDNIESLVAMSPDVVDTPEYKDLMAKIESHNSSQASDEEDEEESEESEEEEEEEESEEESEDEEEEDEEDEEVEEDPDDVFGISGKKKKKNKVKVDFDVPKEMGELLSSRYGIKDPSTFFGSVDSWRAQAQEGSESKKQLDALTSDIRNLPPDLRDSLTRYAEGEDYRAPFTQGERLDFGSDFDEQDVESLVEHYLPEEYAKLVKSYNKEEDAMGDDEFDDKINLLARSTKKLFTNEKKALVDKRVQYENSQKELGQKLKRSALDSVENLSKAFPNFSKSELSKVQTYLVEGKVDDLIYNADGTYTEDAAMNVANMMFGDKMRSTIEKLANRKGKSEANQEIVDSSPKKIKKSKSSNSKGKTNMKAVQHLSSVVENDDPYA